MELERRGLQLKRSKVADGRVRKAASGKHTQSLIWVVPTRLVHRACELPYRIRFPLASLRCRSEIPQNEARNENNEGLRQARQGWKSMVVIKYVARENELQCLGLTKGLAGGEEEATGMREWPTRTLW
ncbi:hypothetical protein QAD02_017410 [Eretmocerus hayati]|uniref:Uncharacterized protein n=1 Tax=Eretmocerus hayati TaxID=131215 RepID=A0ACC2PEX7_9HYME|nr:hypothetical protein QAD02_017410 [Eretmocerus hayati]